MTHTDAERCKHLIIHGNKTQEKPLKIEKTQQKTKIVYTRKREVKNKNTT